MVGMRVRALVALMAGTLTLWVGVMALAEPAGAAVDQEVPVGLVPAPVVSGITGCTYEWPSGMVGEGEGACTGPQGQLCRWVPDPAFPGFGVEDCLFADPDPLPSPSPETVPPASPQGQKAPTPSGELPQGQLPRTGARLWVLATAGAALVAAGGWLSHRSEVTLRSALRRHPARRERQGWERFVQ